MTGDPDESLPRKLKESGYARIADLSDVLAKFALINALPVWFGESPFAVPTPQLWNATATLVRFGDSYLAVTCDHVLNTYDEFRASHPSALFGIFRTPIDVSSCLRERHALLDLAILDVTPHVLSGKLPGERFHVPAVWPPAEVTTTDVIGLAGFPGIWREQQDIAHFRFFTFSSGAGEVASVGPAHLYTRFSFDECVIAARGGKLLGDLGGLSGGPVWAWRSLHAELVGFVKEYQPNYDLLYVRRASVLDRYGRCGQG